ncbi:MAG: TetR/AcrR family transcriptional regulator, partial [Actinomycetales bacterium]
MTETRTKRAYHSPLRQRRAAESRQRIIESSLSLFNELGYSGTTMSAIAKLASVSVESVHGVGQKGDLLLLAFRLAYNGDSRVTDPSWFDQVDATDDP